MPISRVIIRMNINIHESYQGYQGYHGYYGQCLCKPYELLGLIRVIRATRVIPNGLDPGGDTMIYLISNH